MNCLKLGKMSAEWQWKETLFAPISGSWVRLVTTHTCKYIIIDHEHRSGPPTPNQTRHNCWLLVTQLWGIWITVVIIVIISDHLNIIKFL